MGVVNGKSWKINVTKSEHTMGVVNGKSWKSQCETCLMIWYNLSVYILERIPAVLAVICLCL